MKRNDQLSRKIGARFQEDVERSCNEQNIFFHNIKDVYLPPDIRKRVKLPKNKYDVLIFHKGYLFPIELKSTDKKSISFSEKIIKQHQIESLLEATKFDKVIPGFLMNFREPKNRAFFVPIQDFVTYKHIAENQLEHNYKCRKDKKLNKSSIPIDICEEIGFEILNIKKRTRYRYIMTDLIDRLIDDYENNRTQTNSRIMDER